jgi:hypothetical protein
MLMPKDRMLDNWDDLEVFTSKGAKLRDNRITITANSTLIFSSGYCHTASLKNKSHVIMAYSPQNKTIVFQFTNDERANGALKLVKRGAVAQVGSRSFFNYYKLNSETLAGRYEPVLMKLQKFGEVWTLRLENKLQASK